MSVSVTAEINEEKTNNELSSILANNLLTAYQPHKTKVENDLQELIAKQNKLYIEISEEKFKFADSDLQNMSNMMENIKFYKEKLTKMKKQMINIQRRTNSLKTKASNIQMHTQKEVSKQPANLNLS